MDKQMQIIADKVHNDIRLSKEDGLYLYQSNDLLALGDLARYKKLKTSGRNIFFNVNRHINLSNVCVSRCSFCAFGLDEEDGGAYVMTPEEAFNYGAEAVDYGITEFHIVSALHPSKPFEYYLEIVSRLHSAYPDIHIQAFTGVEINYFAQISGLSIREVLQVLKDAGLGSLPGGGAEILNDRIRKKICPKKASTEEWLNVHRTAHELGLKTNCTMLYGHVESIEDRLDHFISLRELQDQYPGFQAFVPLPFLPDNTRLSQIKRTSAVDDIKTMAISRLMLDNIEHIKAFWVMLGIDIAQLSFNFGADDIDGTVVEEKIMHAAGAISQKGITKEDLIQLVKEAGFIPTERDTIYNVIREF